MKESLDIPDTVRKVAHMDLLTATEAADQLGYSVATINRWAAEGRLRVAAKAPGIRGANLFARTDVDALLSPTPGAAS